MASAAWLLQGAEGKRPAASARRSATPLGRRSSACWAGWCGGLMMQTQFRPPSQGDNPCNEFSKEDRRWE
jgi:hypothetical protein